MMGVGVPDTERHGGHAEGTGGSSSSVGHRPVHDKAPGGAIWIASPENRVSDISDYNGVGNRFPAAGM